MTRVELGPDCGNSPKNRLLQDLTLAIARANTSEIATFLTADALWLPVGRKPVEGTDTVIKALTRYGPATKVTIEHVISHGKTGSVSGVVTFGHKQRGFCHVFEFSSAKATHVCRMTSYSVPLPS